ncbi:MAG: hypothetical protein AMXMBFR84_36520 [Candidatus Hydrogenedentota bacterium]
MLLILVVLFLWVLFVLRTPEGRAIRARIQDSVTTRLKSSGAIPAVESGAIQVYFAPGSQDTSDEIDDALIAVLRAADSSLACAFYDFEWEPAADVLVAQHQRGIRVRIVSDSDYDDRSAVQQCVAAGIPVTFDEREPFMHNKFVVVDNRIVWTGSTNVTRNCLFRNDNNALRLESRDLAANFASEFEELFAGLHGRKSPKATPFPEVTVGGMQVECFFAPEDNVQDEIVGEIAASASSIDFMAFSFTAEPLAKAMEQRMQDGVRVRGVFETRNAGSKYSRDEWLAEHGAEIVLDRNPYTMHHKVMIVDRRSVITGSYNFSKAADTQNDENLLILHNADIAERFEREFERLLQAARTN